MRSAPRHRRPAISGEGLFEWPTKVAKAPLGAYAWTGEVGWIVSPADVDAIYEDVTVVLPVADPDADQPVITDVVGYARCWR